MRLDNLAFNLRLIFVFLLIGFSIALIYKFYKLIEAIPLF
jgi:hypothetical protein